MDVESFDDDEMDVESFDGDEINEDLIGGDNCVPIKLDESSKPSCKPIISSTPELFSL